MSLRINEFLTALKQAKTDDDVAKICKSEVAYLRETYALTSFKNSLTKYRNALRASKISLDIPLSLLVLTKEEKEKIDSDYDFKVHEKKKNLTPINPEKMILKAEELCKSDSYLKNTLGLMLLSGRRSIEILKTAKFFKVSEIDAAIEYAKTLPDVRVNDVKSIMLRLSELNCDNAVLFVGQAKTRASNNAVKQPFPIPILTDTDEFLTDFDNLRSKRDFSDMDYDAVNHQTSSRLNGKISGMKHPNNFGALLPPVKCHSHSLRGCYAEICSYFYQGKLVDKSEYYYWLLGHAEGSLGEATTEKYKGFIVIDDDE